MVKEKNSGSTNECKHCRGSLAEVRKRAKFCSNSCRGSYWYFNILIPLKRQKRGVE